MKFIPKLISKPVNGIKGGVGSFKMPKSFTSRLRAWNIIPPSTTCLLSARESSRGRHRRNYVEKQLFGDDKDYTYEDEDEDDEFGESSWSEGGYVIVKKSCSSGGCSEIHQAGACGGERRANTSAWEYGSRRMMI